MMQEGEFCEGRALIVGVWATVVGVLHVTSRSEINVGAPESGAHNTIIMSHEMTKYYAKDFKGCPVEGIQYF